MVARANIWATIFVSGLINFTIKFEFNNKTLLIWPMIELNYELSPRKCCKASTTLLESVSKRTCDKPLCSISLNACKRATASPSRIEYCPSFQVVPAAIHCPLWSRTHQPILVLFTSWWKPASTLHLYQFKGGNTVSMK
jgi:hypothetical protein